jgi:diguanylate cyclase (GGDEF)-like protein/PAS domain S-box-containing protein
MLRVLNNLAAQHDWRFVVLALAVCVLASLAAVNMFQRARVSHARMRATWIGIAGVATGCGIWAAHFIAILTFDPGYTIDFDLGLTALALVAAIAITAIGLAVALYGPRSLNAPVGGAIVGFGIIVMQILAMDALALPGRLIWSYELVAVAVMLAVIFAVAALTIAVRRSGAAATVTAAALLVAAIAAPYIAVMAAVRIEFDPALFIENVAIYPATLATTIAVVVAMMLGMCLIGVYADRRLESQLQAQFQKITAALNNMNQGLCMFDARSRLVVSNDRYLEMYHLTRDKVQPGGTVRDLCEARMAAGTFSGDPQAYSDELLAALAKGETTRVTVECDDGRVIEVVNQPMQGGGWVATHEDITERRRAERDRDEARQFLDTVVENVPVSIVVKAARSRRYVLINRAGEQLFGLSRDEMIGRTSDEFFSEQATNLIAERDDEVLRTGDYLSIEGYPIDTPGNGTRVVSTRRLVLRDADGRPQYLLSLLEDVTERKRAEARIAYMAHHDALTGLPNRAAFGERLEFTLKQAADTDASFALLCMDLDRFKEVNDVFGHSTGDAMLCELANRLQQVAQGAFVARLGGDEFVIVSAGGPQPATAEGLAERLLQAVGDEIEIEGHRLRVGLSIGIAIFPTDARDSATLLAHADAALYRAKADARGSARFFEPEMDKMLRERRALQQDLRLAIERDEILLFYQPQAMIDGRIIGFEALARWRHPKRGMISPATFIPVAEESGLIIPIGEWILREACREAASWPHKLQVAINLSPVQFQHGDLPGLVHTVLLETGLAPSRLVLEITEGVLIGDYSRAVSILRRLKTLGVHIAMDDFGTGYSSLSYLQALPIDKIKIDQAFVANLDRNPHSAAIVRAVIGLGHGLNLPVVAEGVETAAQLEFLSREECNEVQGYLVGRPLPIADYAAQVGRPAPGKRKAAAG